MLGSKRKSGLSKPRLHPHEATVGKFCAVASLFPVEPLANGHTLYSQTTLTFFSCLPFHCIFQTLCCCCRRCCYRCRCCCWSGILTYILLLIASYNEQCYIYTSNAFIQLSWQCFFFLELCRLGLFNPLSSELGRTAILHDTPNAEALGN